MVGYADEIAQLEFVYSGFFLNLAYGCYLNVFSGLLMALGQVPEVSPADQQIISAAIAHKPAGGIHFAELGAQPAIHLVGVFAGDVYAGQFMRSLEHKHQGADVDFLPDMELHGVRVGQGLVVRIAYDNAAPLEENLVHNLLSLQS